MELPVRYDPKNFTIDDAKGRVLFQLSWPGIKKTQVELDTLGNETAEKLNAVFQFPQTEPTKRGPGRPPKK